MGDHYEKFYNDNPETDDHVKVTISIIPTESVSRVESDCVSRTMTGNAPTTLLR